MATFEQRFVAKIVPEPNSGCWLWDASLDGKGYGQVQVKGWLGLEKSTMRRAHRVAYEMVKGPIPDGLDLDHKCRVPSCVNPDHLEPVTRSENLRRGIGPQKTRERRAEQTHRGVRSCRACKGWKGGVRSQDRTHCPHGHPYSGDNLGYDSRGHRMCKTCYSGR